MTTKSPSPVKPGAPTSVETIAYRSVATVPTVDPHDQERLGYNVWRWLTKKGDSLEVAVKTAGAHLLISEEEALERIRASLREQGVESDG